MWKLAAMNNIVKIILAALSVLVVGCGSFDGAAIRTEHSSEYQKLIAEKTDEILADRSFGLSDCVKIALENNLNVRTSKIEQRIAKLNKKVAFSNFLPTVNLDYQYTRWDNQPKVKLGATTAAMHDARIREVTWNIQTSIFDPSTWFLYSLHKRGEEIAELVTKYTRQMTILEVTINYYHCLSLEQAERALASQVTAAVELERQVRAFYEEGLVTASENQKADVHLLWRKTELSRTRNALAQAKADLLTSMGLSPMADISLVEDANIETPAETLEDLVAETLISNPQLFIADRQIAIEKEKVKIAFSGFLPRLIGFAGRTHSSDSYMVYDNYWTYGLAGTMSIFNGFATINEYKVAKQRKEAAFVNREQQTLTLILQVVKAHLNLKDADEQNILTERAFSAASTHFAEVDAKWREGLVHSSEMLTVQAERDMAEMDVMNSRFSQQVSVATLYNVIGTGDIGYEEDKEIDNAAGK
jgi:outer membrane protein TolC